MIRHLKNKEIDKKLWDDCILNAANGIIYGYSWYLDIVAEEWEALVNEDYSQVMPLVRGQKYLMNYIYPPFFSQQLGVFSKSPLTEHSCKEFLSSIPAEYKFVEMNLHISNKWVPAEFAIKENADYILDMSLPYDILRNNYSDNHSRSCVKAEKNNLELFKFADAGAVIEMFRKTRGRFINNLKDHHYNNLIKLVNETAKRTMSRVWTVSEKNGIPVAGAIFFESHDSSIFIFSSITNEGKKLSAMHFLIDNYIKDFCVQKKFLDFEGSNDPDLARFYKGFGSKEFVYLQIKKNQLPPPWSWIKK